MSQHFTTIEAPIKPAEAAFIRAMNGTDRMWRDLDRIRRGQTELEDCAGCRTGLAERIADDYSDDCGTSYVPVNGSSLDEGDWLCAACTAMEAQHA